MSVTSLLRFLNDTVRKEEIVSRLLCLAVCLVAGVTSPVARALPYAITKIADTTTPNPSGGFFTLMGYPSGEPLPPAVSGNNVVFMGTSRSHGDQGAITSRRSTAQ